MYSEPVAGERFFGRDEVMDLLQKRVLALKDGYRQNIALTGQSLAGKSSIIHHFLYNIKEERCVSIYVEVAKEPFRSFADKFIATMLYSALVKKGCDASPDMESLLDMAEEILPQTYQVIRRIKASIEKEQYDEAYSILLGLTSVLKAETGIPCIVILDEFDNLEFLDLKNPFLSFGKVIMIQKDTMYIVTSSRNQAIKRILSEKLSLLFGNFEIVKISGFDLKTAGDYIDRMTCGFEIERSVRAFLIVFTEANPFYLDKLVTRARDIAFARMQNYIDKNVVAEALVDLVYNASGVIHQYLLNFILDLIDTRFKDEAISILVSIASGANRQPLISRGLKSRRSELPKHLAHLVDRGFLSKSGVFYRIDDVVLEFWLKHVYKRKRELLVDGVFNRSLLFQKEALDYIELFAHEFERDTASRLAELFGSFSNDLVQIDSRHTRLPHFTKVETAMFTNSKPYIACSARGSCWIVEPHECEIGENDIVEYMRNTKGLECKIANKLMVALMGIDENAKLLAKELRISVWDLPTINGLLNLYGKKRMVIL